MRITNFRSEKPRVPLYVRETLFGIGLGIAIFTCIVAGALGISMIFG